MFAPLDSRHRLRRLATMGIDVYERRGLARPAVREDEALTQAPAASALPSAPMREGPDARVEMPVLPVLGDLPAPAPATKTEPAQKPVTRVSEAAITPPIFQLRALRNGTGLLLVDKSLLVKDPQASLLRLGDLLRAGLLVCGQTVAERIEDQEFFWPQVAEARHLDQSQPRAVEALATWVRRCTKDGSGFLIAVAVAEHSVANTILGSTLEVLTVPQVCIDAAFISAPDEETHKAAWRALATLGRRDHEPER